MNSQEPQTDDEDRHTAQVLSQSLARAPLSAESLDRMRERVASEFRRTYAARRARRAYPWYAALAATLCAVAMGAILWFEESATVATLAKSSGAGVIHEGPLLGSSPLALGSELHIGQRWEARGPALVDLVSGGTMRLAAGSLIQAEHADQIDLRTGRVYLDFPSHGGHFAIRTDLAVVVHVGTQFEVMQLDGRLRVRVREGSVRVRGAQSLETVEQGMEVVLDPSGRVTRNQYPTDGADWAWVESVTPPYDIEDRALADFLSWVGRETGKQVVYADDKAHSAARTTQLHGSIVDVRPMQALDAVLSTTSLQSELDGAVIRISSRP